MNNDIRLPFTRVFSFVHDKFPFMHEQRVLSLANATTGVLHSASLAISAIGAGLAGIRGLVPKHAIKQVDRLLSNPKFDLDSLATAWVPSLLADRKEAVLALDWTDFDADDHTTLALNLITNHGRASMLLWKTVRKSELAGQRNDIEDQLLTQLADIVRLYINHPIRITIICDRGFADRKLFQWMTDLGFDFVIRFKKGSVVQDPSGDSRKAQDWVPKNGRAKKIEPALITTERFPVAAVVCVKEKGMQEPWCLATSLADKPARETRRCFRGGGPRPLAQSQYLKAAHTLPFPSGPLLVHRSPQRSRKVGPPSHGTLQPHPRTARSLSGRLRCAVNEGIGQTAAWS